MSGFDCDNGRGRDNAAANAARELDRGNGEGVANFLRDVYRTDRRDFANIVRDLNNCEQNGRGDDLTITQNGQVYISDYDHAGRERRISVGRIDCDPRGGGRRDDDCDPRDRGRDPRDRGRDWDRGGGRGRRDDDCDPRDRGRDWDRGGRRGGRGGVDIDIDIRLPGGGIPIPDCYPDVRPLPYPRDRDCDPPVVHRPPYEHRRPPYVDRDCNPPVIRRRDRDCEPDYRRSRGGGGYDQDGEIAGTVIGSVIGGVIGHNNSDRRGRDNTLLGVFAGGALGNVIGREVDRNRNQQNYRWR